MQFSNIFTVLALAMTATALPAADVAARHDSKTCNNEQKSVCCNGGLLGGIGCTVGVLSILTGDTCQGSAYCCETQAAAGAIVNINALNCVKVF
ncbi:hypothetical protein N658DRAFT_496453 [Parathielavia hyrcaniae]|uniref:Hydrophobin n=1 Tax=Parathielavia hyrcaniae TaxID=113614 RepID=A0AAN6Q552_9PEZI|nr:hypothetical protein N658DRAFT_496453 [Parathielavia hyrcaniae]